ncbi:bacteriohemerythrin [Burkholderia cepacia]|uniref:bacteriohemerythrin n=1 Tax=Burkholderia cepacia TaxID=292 RepID=UPI0009BCDA8C|nr:hemerythrin domain-containing protein [Burkholderia cepacia]
MQPHDTQAIQPVFAWREEFELGHEGMDGTHREFVACVQTLLLASDDELATALDAFAAHARHHFDEEDAAMRESNYGSAGCHVDEHAAVLKSLSEVQAALARGRVDVVRSFANALADWFPGHASVMDQGLARWLIERRLGGAPMRIYRPTASAIGLPLHDNPSRQ